MISSGALSRPRLIVGRLALDVLALRLCSFQNSQKGQGVGKDGAMFDRRISIGNLITIGMIFVGLVAGWYQFDTRLTLIEKDKSSMDDRLKKIEGERDQTRDRLISIEVTMREQRAILDRILKAVEGKP